MRFSPSLFLPALLLLASTTIAACGSAAPSSLPTVAADPQYTAAAQTLVSLMTEVAMPDTPTPPSGPVQTGGSGGPGQAQSTFLPAFSDTPSGPTATASVTPTPSITPTPTATPPPTATFAPDDPRSNLGDPVFQDTFSDGSNWFIFEDDHVTMDVSGGKLKMTSLQTGNWDSWMLAYPIVENFYLDAEIAVGKCSGNDRYGLLVRAPDPNQGYLFGVTCDGQFSFRRWDGKRNTWLVDWTSSDLIRSGTGKTNRIGIRSEGRNFSLYANGKELSTVTDGNYRSGGIGLYVGAGETPDFTVEIEEVTLWQIP